MYSVNCVLTLIKRPLVLCFRFLHHRFVRWTRLPATLLLLGTLADLGRNRSELLAENAFLRQQLIILRRQAKRPVYTGSDRLLLILLARAVRTWRQALFIIQPETLLTLASRALPSVLEAQDKGTCDIIEGTCRDRCVDQRYGQEQSTLGS